MKRLLIIDDEKEMLNSLNKILSQKDFDLTLVHNGNDARNLLRTEIYDLIITDLKMPEVSGMEILKTALNTNKKAKVVVISGYGTIEASVQAIQAGAFDFLEKPFTSKKLFHCIDRALNHHDPEINSGSVPDENNTELPGLIYKSQQMGNVVKLVRKIARGEMNVLITGESGTGKEIIARAIHGLSKRETNPFVPVNCGALPENLFESELFGHEKGAFTGAIRTKPGLLEFANLGTFFFDEIAELSMTLQVKLLRMLEDRHIRRVGGQKEIEIDVRIIAASNKDLSQAVRDNKFREDLYYRLNTIQIEIPPLRDRPDDIVPLCYHFLKELCKKNDKTVQHISPEAEEALQLYAWPGNVRELQNMISRAYFLSSATLIQKDDLPLPFSRQSIEIDKEKLNQNYKEAKEYILEKFEIDYLTYHLKKNQGNISQTAIACGLDRRSIHRLIKKYNIVYQE